VGGDEKLSEQSLYLASTAIWTRWLAIAGFIQAFFFIFTVVIAWITLVGKRSLRYEENARLLLRMWYEGKNDEDLKILFDNYERYFGRDRILDETSIEGIKNSIKMTERIDKIRSFIKKMNYFLDNKRIDLKNIELYFSEIFYIDFPLSCRELYNFLKDFNLKFGSKSIDDNLNRSSINIFFKRIGKFKNYNELLKDIGSSVC
jgi:hypothetical protein